MASATVPRAGELCEIGFRSVPDGGWGVMWLDVCPDACGVVETIVLRGVIPTLLAIGVVTAILAAGRVSPGARVAAYAGFWAGILTFGGVALLALQAERGPAEHRWAWPGWIGLFGFGLGFGGLGAYWIWRKSRLVGLVCMGHSFGASSSLLAYYSIAGLRAFTLWIAITVAIGSCLAFLVPRWLIDRFGEREAEKTESLRQGQDWNAPFEERLGELRRRTRSERYRRRRLDEMRRRAVVRRIARWRPW